MYREILQARDLLRAANQHLHDLKDMMALTAYEAGVKQDPHRTDPRRLTRYGHQVNSQSGEDGIIREIFRRIGTSTKIFVEIGVGDGCENNTAFLLSQGWSGFWIDASDSFVDALAHTHPLHRERLRWLVSFVTRENAAELLITLGVPSEIDLLSLDIDQNTYWVWQGLKEFRPRVVVVEYNAALPPDIEWTVEYQPLATSDGSNNYGASLKAMEHLGRDIGYSLVGCEWIGANAFFVRDDLVNSSFAEPFTAENHYQPARFGLLHSRAHRRAILD